MVNYPLAIEEAAALALPTAPNLLPLTQKPNEVVLTNATGGALAMGDLVMLDTTATGVRVVSANGATTTSRAYFRVIAPTVAGNLAAAAQFHLVAAQPVASGAAGRFILFGPAFLNLATSSATIGSLIGTNGTNKTGEVTAIVTLTKIIGLTQVATTTGVVAVYFDGRPPGLAIAA